MENAVKIYQIDIERKRRIAVMDDLQGQEQEGTERSTPNRREKNLGNLVKDKFVEIIIAIILAVIGWIIHDLPSSVNSIDKRLTKVETQTEIVVGNYETLSSRVWAENKIESNEKSLAESDVEPGLDMKILVASSNFSAGMISTKVPTNDINSAFLADIKDIPEEEKIGTNLKNKEDVTKKSIENQTFIMQYEENGFEVFFYGKYNEDGNWDGNCIINRYKSGNLSSIMEATYINGDLQTYKHIFKGMNLKNQEIWYVSDRKIEDDRSISGETTTYFFYGDYKKRFENDNFTEEDMLSVEEFVNTIPSTQEGYYNGYVCDGRYNDESGNAYLIKYKPDGTVRFLYKGNIKNGVPNDNTKNAWSISWGYANDGYYYYEGVFKDGEHGNTPKNWKPMTQEEIEEKLKNYSFNCSLTGLIDESL